MKGGVVIMKIYEKPMAIIEKIYSEDILAESKPVADQNTYSDAYTALAGKAGVSESNTIIFEW